MSEKVPLRATPIVRAAIRQRTMRLRNHRAPSAVVIVLVWGKLADFSGYDEKRGRRRYHVRCITSAQAKAPWRSWIAAGLEMSV
jgi:hypothetical protein